MELYSQVGKISGSNDIPINQPTADLIPEDLEIATFYMAFTTISTTKAARHMGRIALRRRPPLRR